MESYLRHGVGVGEYKRVKQVLELSYNALPYYLKPCFLYLAGFSEDEEIDTGRLYLLWMAEGFISYQDKGPNETLRDVAQRYLIELAMKCMVQLREARIYTSCVKFDSCGLHDLMHDLCSSKADDEKFLRRTDASKNLNGIPSGRRLALPQSVGNSVSRLVIINDVVGDDVSSIDGLEKLKDLRSFLFRKQHFSPPHIVIKERTFNFEMSQCLRVFAAEGCTFEGNKLPNKVGELIHLRYLSLKNSKVRKLPKSICSLPYLQTLDLRVLYFIRLPNVIWKMKRLKHLFLYLNIKVIGWKKLRLDGLVELETLESIDSETACIADIPKLARLQTLHVVVRDVDSMSIVVSNKNRQLREISLKVRSCDLSSEKGRVVLNDGLMCPSLVSLVFVKCNMRGSFPDYKQGMCQNLVTLELSDCKVDVMEFGKYPMLQYLELSQLEMTETLICHSDSFPQLKKLHLLYLDDLKKWEVEERAMPKLTCLRIEGCNNLENVPDGLRFISSLREIKIVSMPREFMERVKEEDYAPSVKIDR
ncbi:putative disease resistance protein RF45 [Salvia divinorum]|uniref:Disease resistance protein RF45 n=1 Tax=Salvia divinorum TaxID=28513 RepID=A0ABD1GU65_SALDI